MVDNGLSAGDVLAITNSRNNDGMWGDGAGWIWIILALAVLGGGWGNGFGFGNGFGGYGGFAGGALTEAQLCNSFNFNGLENGVRGIQQGICDSTYALNNSIMSGFHGVDNAICSLGYQTQQGFNGVERAVCNLGYQNQAGFNALSSQLASCCCDIERGIERGFCDTNNTIHNTSRNIIDNQNSNTRAILDFLTQDKINTLQAENTSLKFAASQAKQNDFITAVGNSIVSRLETPCPVPSYSVFPPTPVYVGNPYAVNNFGCNSGCGCGC